MFCHFYSLSMYLLFSGESSEKQGKKYVTNIFYTNIQMYKKKKT